MLLAIDIGNTNIKLGLYKLPQEWRGGDAAPAEPPARPQLTAHWRLTTNREMTSDEFGMLFTNLFALRGITMEQIGHVIVCSVVPTLDGPLRQACEAYFHCAPLFVEPGIKTGMPVLVDNPAELGADRLADSVAAYDKYGGPCIVVNFGTATKFEVVSAKGEYLGGNIAPGLGISADALFARAAKLGRIEIKRPAKVIGTNTVTHLQSGIYFGYLGLVDGILEKMIAELGSKPKVVASGGNAGQVARESKYIELIDEMLTLDGLVLLFERNMAARNRGRQTTR